MWAVVAHDRPGRGAAAERARLLAAHLAYIETIIDRIDVAGPLRDAGGDIVGSLLIFDVGDAAAARALLTADPYAGAEIWASVEVFAFAAVAGRWVGGTAWDQGVP